MWKIIQVFPGIWHPFCYSDSEALCAPCPCPSMLHVQEWIYALSAALRAGSDLLCAFSCWRSIVTIDAVESVHPQMLQKHQKAPVHHRMSLNIRTFIWNIEEAGSFFFLGRVESTNGSCLVHSQCAYVTYVYRYPGGSVAVFVIGASIRTRRWMEWSPKRISADEVVASRKVRWVIRNRDSDSKATHFDGSRRSFRRSSIANPPRTYSIGSIVNYLILNS